MTITTNDLMKLLIGAKVVITDCEANVHDDNDGCLCKYKGTIQTIDGQHNSGFTGEPSWTFEGLTKRARLTEMTLLL